MATLQARSKDKIAAAMQSMFPAPKGKADMLDAWTDSVAAQNKSRAHVDEESEKEKAEVLQRKLNAITARKKVRNFLLNNDLGQYADAVIGFGADSMKRLKSLTVRRHDARLCLSLWILDAKYVLFAG